MREWGTLEVGDVIVERPEHGDRVYVVVWAGKRIVELWNLTHGVMARCDRWPTKWTRPLNEAYEVIERA